MDSVVPPVASRANLYSAEAEINGRATGVMRTRVVRHILSVVSFLLAASVMAGQGGFALITGKTFDSAMVRDFYLEGNSIPVEKRNAALIRTPLGARVEFALLDTSGYSSQVQEKYSGMVISEGDISIGGAKLGVGSFGFGIKTPHPPDGADAEVFFYDQAGKQVGECRAQKSANLKVPRPLQVVLEGVGAHLYLGVYGMDLR
jgi:hypothetical protein